MQKVEVKNFRGLNSNITDRNVSVTINLKVLNLTSSSNFDVEQSVQRGVNYASNSFSAKNIKSQVADQLIGTTKNKVNINVKATINFEFVKSINEVSDSDHLLMMVDGVDNSREGGNVGGWGKTPGNISMVEFRGRAAEDGEVIAHELGHNLGLDFSSQGGDSHTADGRGLMGSSINGDLGLDKNILFQALKTFSAAGALPSFQATWTNTKSNAKSFFSNYANDYDSKKAKATGIKND